MKVETTPAARACTCRKTSSSRTTRILRVLSSAIGHSSSTFPMAPSSKAQRRSVPAVCRFGPIPYRLSPRTLHLHLSASSGRDPLPDQLHSALQRQPEAGAASHLSTDAVVVMMPKSMTFRPGLSAAYAPDTQDATAQTYVARSVSPSQPLDFTLSGTGQLPRDTAATGQDAQGGAQTGTAAGQTDQMQSATANDIRPGGGLGNPIDPDDTHDPWAKYKWWILGGLALALAAAAGILVQRPGPAPAAGVVAPLPAQNAAAAFALGAEEELFALETERLEGKLSDESYAQQKSALETVLRRALARG